MTDKAPALATADEARELLGADVFNEAVEDGTVRRVQTPDGSFHYLGADLDKVARDHDPHHLARVVNGEADDSDDGPRALAKRQRRL